MAVRGVYTEEEKSMPARFEEMAEAMSGWRKPLNTPVATGDSIERYALAVDPWNPLWSDADYAS